MYAVIQSPYLIIRCIVKSMLTCASDGFTDNDRSVLENMHASTIFKIATEKEGCDVFESIPRKHFVKMRNIIIDMILATDLSKHFENLTTLNARLSSISEEAEKDVFQGHTGLMVRVAVKAADLGYMGKTAELHKSWNRKLIEEFYAQGDVERKKGMDVSPLMDRKMSEELSQNQVDFINLFAKPLFIATSKAFSGVSEIVKNVESNLDYWTTYQRENGDFSFRNSVSETSSHASKAETIAEEVIKEEAPNVTVTTTMTTMHQKAPKF